MNPEKFKGNSFIKERKTERKKERKIGRKKERKKERKEGRKEERKEGRKEDLCLSNKCSSTKSDQKQTV